MSASTYVPNPGTVPWRVIQFLQANEGEELSKSDIAAKFECKADGVDTILASAMRAGLINKARSDGLIVFRLGTVQVKLQPMRESTDEKPVRKFVRARSQNVEFDPSSIQVRKKTPLRTPEQERRQLFDAFLRKLDVGDSAEFDEAGLITLKHHVKRYGKATQTKFTLRVLGAGRAGIERTA